MIVKKGSFVMIMIILLLAVAGCSSQKHASVDNAEPRSLEWIISNNYMLSGKSNGISPHGIAVLSDSVFICDRDDHCLREFDFNGKELRTVGQFGNGKGEFIRPTGLSYSNESFYVVDSGNNRIQILDKDLEYQQEYILDQLSRDIGTFYTDIAVGKDGTGIVLTNSVVQENARAYVFDSNGSVQKTSFVINGYASCEDNRIYCVNTFELFKDGTSHVAEVKGSKLFEYTNSDIREICELPYKYTPTDFVIEGDDLYVLSCGWAQLDHFKTDGSYIETIWEFEQLDPESFLDRTPQGGFIVTDGQNKTVYFLSRKSD